MVVPMALASATLRISASDNKLMFSTLAMLPPELTLGETPRARFLLMFSRSGCRRETEDLPRLCGRGRSPVEARAVVDDFLHQLGVARREPVGGHAQIVLEPGPAVTSGGEAPLIDFPLVPANACSDPGRLRQHIRDLASQEIEDRPTRGHCVGNTHHELHVRRILEQS